MPGYARRGAEHWFQQADGSWLRWDAPSASWQPGDPPAARPGEAREAGWPDYRSVSFLWKAVVILLVIASAIDAMAAISDLLQYDLLDGIRQGTVTLSEAEANDLRQMILGYLQTAALLATGIPFIVWIHRAYSNLPTLGVDSLRFRRWWAIGGWFIPVASLVRPKQVINDVWRGSDPALSEPVDLSWQTAPVPWWWMGWWLGFIVSNQIANAMLFLDLPAGTLEELRTATLGFLIADSLSAVTGVLAILIVRSASLRQIARATRLGVEHLEGA